MSDYSGDTFLPALLDRLSQSGTGSLRRSDFRKTVIRDLALLLNCTNLEKQLSLDKYPLVKFSVLNFGIPSLAGARLSEADLATVAARIQQTVEYFEPRILENTLKVTVAENTNAELYNQAHFKIEASYWFEPYPIDMVIRALWDMETGGMDLREES
jgi:type VI secretion system protein ImpF